MQMKLAAAAATLSAAGIQLGRCITMSGSQEFPKGNLNAADGQAIPVMPAKAGIQSKSIGWKPRYHDLDTGFRRYDGSGFEL
jgi:hypothetical protein